MQFIRVKSPEISENLTCSTNVKEMKLRVESVIYMKRVQNKNEFRRADVEVLDLHADLLIRNVINTYKTFFTNRVFFFFF